MIERRPMGDGQVELTFRLPADHPADPVGVAGEFNDWVISPLADVGGKLEATTIVADGRRRARLDRYPAGKILIR